MAEECELGNMESIRTFAKRWNDAGKPIDVLSLNAGAQFVGQKEPKRTQDGFELTVGVNHLGHFLLANLLLPALERSSKQPRVVVTSSEVRYCTNVHATLNVNRQAAHRRAFERRTHSRVQARSRV